MDTIKPKQQPPKQGKMAPKPATPNLNVKPMGEDQAVSVVVEAAPVINRPEPVIPKPTKPVKPVRLDGTPLEAVAGVYTLVAALVCDGPLLAKSPSGGNRHSEPRSIPTGEKYVVLCSGERAFIRTGVISPSGVGEWQASPIVGLAVLEPVLSESFEVIVPVVVYGAEPQSIFTTTALITFTLGEDNA